jgi:hypothetical protein
VFLKDVPINQEGRFSYDENNLTFSTAAFHFLILKKYDTNINWMV